MKPVRVPFQWIALSIGDHSRSYLCASFIVNTRVYRGETSTPRETNR
jgi:hypothetical protein